MPQIVAWQSSYTGEVFTSEEKYKTHNRKQAAFKRDQAKKKKIKDDFLMWLNNEQINNLSDISLLPAWIITNQRKLMDGFNAIPGYGTWTSDKFFDTDEIIEIKLDIRWKECVSNSHASPRHGVSNWCARDKTKPVGYPGWYGRIEGTLKREPKHNSDYPMSGLLKMIDVITGTGGGGNKGWGYEVSIFAQDWAGPCESITFSKLQTGKIAN